MLTSPGTGGTILNMKDAVRTEDQTTNQEDFKMANITFQPSSKIEDFFDGSTSDRTLRADRVVEILESYVKSRTREDGKREDLKIVRELSKSAEMKEKIRAMREAMNKS
jgi:hypothetical protein